MDETPTSERAREKGGGGGDSAGVKEDGATTSIIGGRVWKREGKTSFLGGLWCDPSSADSTSDTHIAMHARR